MIYDAKLKNENVIIKAIGGKINDQAATTGKPPPEAGKRRSPLGRPAHRPSLREGATRAEALLTFHHIRGVYAGYGFPPKAEHARPTGKAFPNRSGNRPRSKGKEKMRSRFPRDVYQPVFPRYSDGDDARVLFEGLAEVVLILKPDAKRDFVDHEAGLIHQPLGLRDARAPDDSRRRKPRRRAGTRCPGSWASNPASPTG